MSNSETLLIVYDMVLSGQPHSIQDFMRESGCSRRTCFRYLKAIRAHLEKKGEGWTLTFDRKLRRYELRKRIGREIVG